MPQIFKIGSYVIYFWSNENTPLEPVHIHAAESRQMPDKESFQKAFLHPADTRKLFDSHSKNQKLIRLQDMHFCFWNPFSYFIIRQQHRAAVPLCGHFYFVLFSVQIAEHCQLLRPEHSFVCQHHICPCFQKRNFSLRNDRIFFPHGSQLFVKCENGIGFFLLLLYGHFAAQPVRHRNPRPGIGKPAVLSRIPLHRGPAVVPGPGCQNLKRFFFGPAKISQNLIVIQALYILILPDGSIMRIQHSDFFSLVNIRRPAHKMNHACQHFGRLFPVYAFIPQPAGNAGLVVVAPEQCVPAVCLLHSKLPFHKQLLQPSIVRSLKPPFVPVFIIHLQMVELEAHRKFVFLRCRIPDAVFQRCGRHFSYGYQLLNARIPDQLFQIQTEILFLS